MPSSTLQEGTGKIDCCDLMFPPKIPFPIGHIWLIRCHLPAVEIIFTPQPKKPDRVLL